MKVKRFFLAILLIFFVFQGISQNYDVSFNSNENFRNIHSTDVDTVSGVDAISKIFFVNKGYSYSYNLQFSADTIDADSVCYFYLHGSVDGVFYYPIDTVKWYMTADTTGLISVTSSNKVGWRFMKLTLASTKGAAKLNKLSLSVLE
jgi:hypothetical protein